jgi:hypothetical protein
MGGLVIAAAPIFASLGNIRLAIGVIATGLALSLWSLVSDYLSDRKINSLPKDKLVAKGNEVLDLRIEELSAKVAQAELEVRSFEEADDSSAGTVPLLKATRKS